MRGIDPLTTAAGALAFFCAVDLDALSSVLEWQGISAKLLVAGVYTLSTYFFNGGKKGEILTVLGGALRVAGNDAVGLPLQIGSVLGSLGYTLWQNNRHAEVLPQHHRHIV